MLTTPQPKQHLIRNEKQFLLGIKDAKMGNYPRDLYPSEDYCRGYSHEIDRQNSGDHTKT